MQDRGQLPRGQICLEVPLSFRIHECYVLLPPVSVILTLCVLLFWREASTLSSRFPAQSRTDLGFCLTWSKHPNYHSGGDTKHPCSDGSGRQRLGSVAQRQPGLGGLSVNCGTRPVKGNQARRLGVPMVSTLNRNLCPKSLWMGKTVFVWYTLDLAAKLLLAPLAFTRLPVSRTNWRQRQEPAAASLAGSHQCRLLRTVLIFTVSLYRWQAVLIFHLWQ